jgi:hypothetical protein
MMDKNPTDMLKIKGKLMGELLVQFRDKIIFEKMPVGITVNGLMMLTVSFALANDFRFEGLSNEEALKETLDYTIETTKKRFKKEKTDG